MNIFAVVGLGYVGLGLAIALSKQNKVIGFDINKNRIQELQRHDDHNQIIPTAELSHPNLTYTYNLNDIKDANFYIVSVSTPAHFYEIPNLGPLVGVVEALGSILKKGDIIVFESTVYPGTTDSICIPRLEKISNLKHGIDFHVGYSPERISPGDETHTLKTITKIVSAQDEQTLKTIQTAYESICDNVYPVSNIRTAEAIKILENTQRDINIATMNEFAKIMHALDIDMDEVLKGAQTKWGFVPFKPGLVGGHCISIDPHYLAFKAKRLGVFPELILTARKVNDGMTQFIIQSMLKLIFQNKINPSQLKLGLFGITYKEDVLDLRNSMALKLNKELHEYGFDCHIHDPLVQSTATIQIEDFQTIKDLSIAIVVVGHDFYRQIGLHGLLSKCNANPIVMDIPSLYIDEHKLFDNLIYWKL